MQFFVLLLPLGYGLAVSAWLAPHACTQCPTFRFIGFGGNSATIVFVGEFGRITALRSGSYSYWFRNYGCTGGFCGGSCYFKEL